MYKITKKYDGYPSKNKIEADGLTLEEAQAYLEGTARLWGGEVISHSSEELIVEDGHGENRDRKSTRLNSSH